MAKTKPDKTKKLCVNGKIREPKLKVKLRHHKTWKEIQVRIREIQESHRT